MDNKTSFFIFVGQTELQSFKNKTSFIISEKTFCFLVVLRPVSKITPLKKQKVFSLAEILDKTNFELPKLVKAID